jgi:lipid-A-disaccharide synthase
MKHDLFIFAGETSGDLHGEALIQSLLEENPKLKIYGVGGPRMRKLPFTCTLPMEEFQVMGFVDVFLALPRLFRHFYALANYILKTKPKAALFIDYPGFNLRMERYLRKKGFKGKLIHYICPSVWGHGKGRISLMEKNLDLLLSIFPFEKELFSDALSVEYVGHPLVDRIENEPKHTFSWADGRKVISLFPGSRKKEILLNFPLQLKAFKSIASNEELIGAVSVSQEAFLPLLKTCIENEGLKDRIKLIPAKDTYILMRSSYFAIAKSGTVTLELAIHKVPTVVTYGIAPLDLFIAKNILRISLPFYCIVNILLKKQVFKELIGPALTEKALNQEVKNLLDPSYILEVKKLSESAVKLLGTKKASRESARLISKLTS